MENQMKDAEDDSSSIDCNKSKTNQTSKSEDKSSVDCHRSASRSRKIKSIRRDELTNREGRRHGYRRSSKRISNMHPSFRKPRLDEVPQLVYPVVPRPTDIHQLEFDAGHAEFSIGGLPSTEMSEYVGRLPLVGRGRGRPIPAWMKEPPSCTNQTVGPPDISEANDNQTAAINTSGTSSMKRNEASIPLGIPNNNPTTTNTIHQRSPPTLNECRSMHTTIHTVDATKQKYELMDMNDGVTSFNSSSFNQPSYGVNIPPTAHNTHFTVESNVYRGGMGVHSPQQIQSMEQLNMGMHWNCRGGKHQSFVRSHTPNDGVLNEADIRGRRYPHDTNTGRVHVTPGGPLMDVRRGIRNEGSRVVWSKECEVPPPVHPPHQSMKQYITPHLNTSMEVPTHISLPYPPIEGSVQHMHKKTQQPFTANATQQPSRDPPLHTTHTPTNRFNSEYCNTQTWSTISKPPTNNMKKESITKQSQINSYAATPSVTRVAATSYVNAAKTSTTAATTSAASTSSNTDIGDVGWFGHYADVTGDTSEAPHAGEGYSKSMNAPSLNTLYERGGGGVDSGGTHTYQHMFPPYYQQWYSQVPQPNSTYPPPSPLSGGLPPYYISNQMYSNIQLPNEQQMRDTRLQPHSEHPTEFTRP